MRFRQRFRRAFSSRATNAAFHQPDCFAFCLCCPHGRCAHPVPELCGLRGLELAKIVAATDALILPVGHSVFDRESAAQCVAELRQLSRVAAGRCRVGVVGMRLDTRTRGEAVLRAWAGEHGLPFVGALRETQGYVRCAEQGLTMFDLPAARVQADLDQWRPILDWLQSVLSAAPRTDVIDLEVEAEAEAAVAEPVAFEPPVLLGQDDVIWAPRPSRSTLVFGDPAHFQRPRPRRQPPVTRAGDLLTVEPAAPQQLALF